MYQAKIIKDKNGSALVNDKDTSKRWGEYFEQLMNVENERIERDVAQNEKSEVEEVSRTELKSAMKRMKKGKAVCPDDIPVEAWECLGDEGIDWLTNLFNSILASEEMPEEWRASTLVPIFKNKGDIQECKNYRGIKLMSHTMKMWERVIEKRLRDEVTISDEQFGFMPGRNTTDAIFALRQLMEKYREGRQKIHCVFLALEKAYDKSA